MRQRLKFLANILDRSIDWFAIIAYALHNIFLAMAIEAGTSRLGTYLTERGISPLWIIVFLMFGLVWSACLWMHWKIRIFGTIPLAITAIFTVAVYFADNAPMRTIFGIAGLYYSLAAMPIIVMVLYGRLTDALRRSYDMEDQLRQMEARFGNGKAQIGTR